MCADFDLLLPMFNCAEANIDKLNASIEAWEAAGNDDENSSADRSMLVKALRALPAGKELVDARAEQQSQARDRGHYATVLERSGLENGGSGRKDGAYPHCGKLGRVDSLGEGVDGRAH